MSKNEVLNIKDLIKVSDSNFIKEPFPTFKEQKTMTLEEFLEIPPIPINRDTYQRRKSVVRNLQQPLPKHNEVDIIHYRGDTVFKPAHYQKDHYYVADGNTRQDIWRQTVQFGRVIDPNIPQLKVPMHITANIYDICDPTEAEEFYYSIDSVEAVETKGHKITGGFRANDLLNRLTNNKMKKGSIGVALNLACPTVNQRGGNDLGIPGVHDVLDQVRILKDVIIALDKANAPGRGHYHVNSTLGITMMAGKAMETSSEWESLMSFLANGENNLDFKNTDRNMSIDDFVKLAEDNFANDSVARSAVIALLVGNLHNNVNTKNNVVSLPYFTGFGQNPTLVKNYLSYVWLEFMDGNDFDPISITETKIHGKYLELRNRAYSDMV